MSSTSTRRGYTLVELLVVISIVALLATVSIGVFASLGRKNALQAAAGEMSAVLRRARNAAREERFPVRILLDADDGRIRTYARRTVALFRFEPSDVGGGAAAPVDPTAPAAPVSVGSVQGARGVRGDGFFTESGEQGAIGSCLLLEEPGAHLLIPHQAIFAAREGLQVEVWIRTLDLKAIAAGIRKQRGEAAGDSGQPWAFTIMSKGEVWELCITEDYALEAAVVGVPAVGGDPDGEPYRVSTRNHVITPGRWMRVEMVFDRDGLHLAVDGIGRHVLPMAGADYSVDPPARLISRPTDIIVGDEDPDYSLPGAVDELRISAIVAGDPVVLPATIALLASQPVIAYDARGSLEGLVHDQPVVIVLTDDPDTVSRLLSPPDVIDEEAAGGTTTATDDEGSDEPDPRARIVPDPEGLTKEVAATRRVVLKVDLAGGLRR